VIDATEEVISIKLRGEARANAAAHLEPNLFLEGRKHYEKTFRTFDNITFSRYHHEGKVQKCEFEIGICFIIFFH
jgi:hypothetical protein